MAKKSVSALDVRGKRVLVRVDFNVPLDDHGVITDDRRIRMALPTIRKLVEGGGRVILASHLGRPAGKGYEADGSLIPAAARLAKLLAKPVAMASDSVGPAVESAVAGLRDGDVLMLENVRFHAAETIIDAAKKNPDKKLTPEQAAAEQAYAEGLAKLADVYVNDAFGTCHRKHVSMYALPKLVKAKGGAAAVGFLVDKELKFLGDAVSAPKRPLVGILGGAKVSDKIKVIESLLGKCDAVLVGGAMAYTFFLAQGRKTGKSLVEPGMVDTAKALLAKAAGKIKLPVDTLCAQAMKAGQETKLVEGDIPDGWEGFDIGPKTAAAYAAELSKAGTVLWNGPMGVFEIADFAKGTQTVATALAEATQKSGVVSIIGGGDSAAAVEQAGLAEKVTHVSTGGGASLEFLEGKPFATLEILDEA